MRRYYEFALVAVILMLVLSVALRLISSVQKDAEFARVQAEIMSIRAQLMERSVHRETFGGGLPDSANPMDWIAEPPADYRAQALPDRSEVSLWYFDPQAKLLVYRYRDGEEAYFRLSRQGGEGTRGIPGGIGLVRVEAPVVKVN